MTFTPFQIPPGMVADDTSFDTPGRWYNGSLVRFWDDNWQIKGGWERLTLSNLGGICRNVFCWHDVNNNEDVAFGLHNGLQVWQGGQLYNITPTYYMAAITLGANPLTTTNGSTLVTVAQTTTPPVNPGDQIALAGATAVGGITPNGIVSVVANNGASWTFNWTSAATSSATGGGSAMTMQPFWRNGQTDGTGSAGYGTGAYGLGTYSTPSTADYFPLTWSLANYGGDLMANPRNQTIFWWKENTSQPAIICPNAPAQVTYMVVVPQRQVMALGCNEETSGVFDPLCIRWSDIEDPTDWVSASSNNAGEWVLESGGRIVCGRVVGDYVFVWTSASLFLGTFVGAVGQTWKFEKIGDHCGSISPGSPIVTSQYAAWIAPDRSFWTCSLGGAPEALACVIRQDFMENTALGQDDKLVGGSTSTFEELTWWYADQRDGLEISRAITVGPGGWSRDLLPRSAYVDAGPNISPIGVDPSGNVYWHEKGNSADGQPLIGWIESTAFYLGEGDGGFLVNGMYPDFREQIGPLTMTIYTRQYPQDTERTQGPWTLAPSQNKRSFRISGRIARLRFDWNSSPAFARGGKPEFDVEPIGGR